MRVQSCSKNASVRQKDAHRFNGNVFLTEIKEVYEKENYRFLIAFH
jgi:hypothetical protein